MSRFAVTLILIAAGAATGSAPAQSSTPVAGADRSLDRTPVEFASGGDPSPLYASLVVVTGQDRPGLVLAQRAIERTIRGAPRSAPPDSDEYVYVEVEGWKSPAQAALLSGIVPGAGQWYVGNSSRYVFLGVEAIALYSYFHFRSVRDDKRDEAYAYAGDPRTAGSRWSFAEYDASATAEEAARMREIFSRDRDEFYSLIGSDDRYLAGWTSTGGDALSARRGYRSLDDERQQAQRRSRYGLMAAVANHVVSLVDALRSARVNNVRVTEDLSLRLDARPGRRSHFFAVLTHTFP